MNIECPPASDAAAYVAGELSACKEAAFEAHLTTCGKCRSTVDSIRRVIGRLRSVPEMECAQDLALPVLARVRAEAEVLPHPPGWWRAAGIAALLALFAGGAMLTHFKISAPREEAVAAVADENAASVARALEWLCQNQEPNGSWDAEKWGGHRRFEVALTALPTLAILSGDVLTPQQSSAVLHAAQWLQAQQTGDGYFGPDFQGASYNQSIATLALLRAHQRQPNPTLERSLDAALSAIVARQTADGGWGYFHSPFADRSITEWHIEALELASALGWKNVRPHLARGRAWLAAHSDARAAVEEPVDSPSATIARADGAGDPARARMDFYRAYFITAALRREHDAASLQRLAAIRHTLLVQQNSDGPDAGSWSADDHWGRAGGRLYSTALASLVMRER